MSKTLEEHQTVTDGDFTYYPDGKNEKVVACSRKTVRKDLYVDKKLAVKFLKC